ncbi:hypothetical protein MATL_G00176200 [Megalops atlanticus]|uniref:THD domain-containing protein n=1 Tax=Megalops atlanticus TaxID=7932 RepID=A0A9D3PQI0_MEGAT|nr:hypothetical protein MATL_G00176200 [Megalops atlanticus]
MLEEFVTSSPRAGQVVRRRRLAWVLLVLALAVVVSAAMAGLALYRVQTLQAQVASPWSEELPGRGERLGDPTAIIPLGTRQLQEPGRYEDGEGDLQRLSGELEPVLSRDTPKTRQDGHTSVPLRVTLLRGTALQEEDSTILVREGGFYFVYSQVYYTDKTFAMGHIILQKKRNVAADDLQEVPLFRCIQDMNQNLPHNTCYTAGVVRLQAGDKVELLIPRQSASVSLDTDSTFFGAFKML